MAELSDPTRSVPPRRVEPRLVRGMVDRFSGQEAERQKLVDSIRRVYESYGFQPLATPAIEHQVSLVGAGGAEATQQIFRVAAPEGEHDELGLRFDLTVPLARVVAQYQQELPRPFKRYQVAPVWRQDKPGPGRYREFVQFDIDSVGTSSALADAEIVSAMRDVFETLLPADARGSRFQILFSDRRILNLLLLKAGASEIGAGVLRVLDKRERIGPDKVRLELGSGYADLSGDRIAGLGLDAQSIDTILAFLAISGSGRLATVEQLREFFAGTEGANATLDAVTTFCSLLDAHGVTEEQAALDVSIARGLAYYTGPVFETKLRDAPQFGSVCSGGRYDDLVSRFSGTPWPGVGASVGVDRLLAALEKAGSARPKRSVDVFVTTMDKERVADYVALAQELRAAGLVVDLFAGVAGGFGKQMKHADKLGAAVVLIAGSDEFAKGTVTVKPMAILEPADAPGESLPGSAATRDAWLAEQRNIQSEVPRAEVVARVLALLGRQ